MARTNRKQQKNDTPEYSLASSYRPDKHQRKLRNLLNTTSENLTEREVHRIATTFNLAAYCMEYGTLPDQDPDTGLYLPFSFKKFPFQMEVYADMFPKIVIKKGLQLGASEYAVLKAIHACDKLGLDVMMGFPHSRQITRFSQTRIRRMIQRTEHFKNVVADRTTNKEAVKNTSLYSIKDKFYYLVGVASDSEIQSESVDVVIRDEFDLMDQENAATLLKRNSASNKKMNLDLGFPTIEKQGIDEQFKDSDQREYFVKCDRCGEWQEILWPRNVNIERMERICWKCGNSIERPLRDLRCGKWIPAKAENSNKRHGYHLHTLLFPGLDFEDFMKDANNIVREKEFYNYQLGLAHSQRDIQISDAVINKCIRRDQHLPKSGRPIFGGVDVGAVLHAWFEEVKEVHGKFTRKLIDCKIFSGDTKFDQLDAYIRSLQPAAVCVDIYPEVTQVNRLIAEFPGMVWGLAFDDFTNRPQEEANIKEEDLKRGHFFVRANRTYLLDCNAEDFINGIVQIPGEALALYKDIPDQFKVMVRVTETVGAKGVSINRWKTPGSKPDHWAFARAASIAASKLEGWLINAGARSIAAPSPDDKWEAGYQRFRRKVR